MADIPGLIEGAADGAGLGHRFLKHLQRTGVLLHLIDMAPVDPAADPVRDALAIANELKRYDAQLAAKPRWLVINKRDLMPDDEAEKRAREIVKALRFKGAVHLISAATQRGTRELAEAVMRFLEERRAAAAAAAVVAGTNARVAAPAPAKRRLAAKQKNKVAVAPASRGKPRPNVQARQKARPQAVIKAESKARLKAKAKSRVKAKARAKRDAKGTSRARARSRRA
jgi:GTPase involved in cell partitioning and DNA repair